MNKKINVILVLISLNFFVQRAIACGGDFKGIVSGPVMLGIEYHDRGEKKYAMDDDGMLVLSIIASYCRNEVRRRALELTPSQKECIRTHEQNIDYQKRISIYGFNEKEMSNQRTNQLILNKCSVNLIKLWTAENDRYNKTPLSCKNKVKGLLPKISQLNETYFQDIFRSENFKRINDREKRRLWSAYEKNRSSIQNFTRLARNRHLKMKDFEEWETNLHEAVKENAYPVVPDPNQIESGEMVRISEVMIDMGIPFFGARSRCGPPFPKDIIGKINSSSWFARSGNGGAQTQTQGVKND